MRDDKLPTAEPRRDGHRDRGDFDDGVGYRTTIDDREPLRERRADDRCAETLIDREHHRGCRRWTVGARVARHAAGVIEPPHAQLFADPRRVATIAAERRRRTEI